MVFLPESAEGSADWRLVPFLDENGITRPVCRVQTGGSGSTGST
jgi:hypothetical protein